MSINVILVLIIVVALAYMVFLLMRKFPSILNINVDSLPSIKAKRQKDLILSNRLQRGWLESWAKFSSISLPWRDKINTTLVDYYRKLKNLEKDLKRRGHKKLTSSVGRSQAVDELVTRAKQNINSEEYGKAEDLLLDALSFDQHNIDAYKVLAEVYRYRKEYVQAKETLEYLLKLTHNQDAGVYHSLADVARERGNLKQAEEDYLKSISLSDDNYLHFLSLAEVYQDLEDNVQALETAQRALLLSSNNPKILDFLINISIIMQDKELALQYLDKLREVNPENNKITEFGLRIDELA